MNPSTGRFQLAALCSLTLMLAGCLANIESTPGDLPPPVNPPVVPIVPPVEPVTPVTTSASITLEIAPVSPSVSVGQSFEVEVQVRNGGDGMASGVAPSTPFQTGVGHAMLVTPPTPGISDLAPGETKVFVFGYLATDPGGINFDVNAAGTDIANDRAITAANKTAQLVVEAAAGLAIDKIELPLQANINDTVVVKVTVSNPGQATARAVKPTLTGSTAMTTLSGPVPAQADITGGMSATFVWTVRPTASGPLTLTALAAGADDHSKLPISGSGTSMPIMIDAPAGLDVMVSLPATASTGQSFTATVVVTNTGTAIAKGVGPTTAPILGASTGTASATIATNPAGTQDIPGGASATFRWTLNATGTGTLSLRTTFGGTDGNTNTALTSVTATSNPLQVLAPTALVVAQVAGPASIGRGQAFNVLVTVRNNGGSGATNVTPSPSPLTAAVTGGSAVTLTQLPVAQDIPAGAQAIFTFAYVETGTAAGTLAFSAGATGISTTGATVTAPAVQSALIQVVLQPALVTETVTVPAKVSRGQTFDVVVTVFNSGGASISAVRPAVAFASTGGAAATAGTLPAAVTLAAGARATIRVPFIAGTTSSGGLTASVVSSGTSSLSTLTISSAPKVATATLVQAPAQLVLGSFTLPAAIDRGTGFTLSLRITNAGEADAVGVTPVPSPPMAVVTGSVTVSTSTTAAPVTIAGGASQTFTWIYSETGTAPGTLAFNAGANGKDANTNVDIFLAPTNSNSSSVATPVGCNGANLYIGAGGVSLDADRIDLAPNTNRLRVKPYSMLPTEFQRVLSTTPSRIQNQAQTFDAPVTRWAKEQQLSGVSLYQGFLASFQGCVTFVAGPAQYAAAPTAATATTECAAFQRRFWSAIPTAAETQTCATFATSAANNDTDPRRRWAYVCAAVLTSAQFLAD